MWRENGFLGFYQGVVPAVVKGAATNLIRFPVYGMLKRIVQGSDRDSAGAVPLTPMQSMLCGGTAGAISAVFTQPIDTVKANMMGLDAGRFRSRSAVPLSHPGGGPLVLMNGVGPRVRSLHRGAKDASRPIVCRWQATRFPPLLLLTCFHRPSILIVRRRSTVFLFESGRHRPHAASGEDRGLTPIDRTTPALLLLVLVVTYRSRPPRRYRFGVR